MYQTPYILIVKLEENDVVRTSDGYIQDGAWDFEDQTIFED